MNSKLVVRSLAAGGMVWWAAAGCSVQRPALTQQELEVRRHERTEWTREFRRRSVSQVLERWEYEHAEYLAGRSTEPARLDMLILSGGGDFGAFGAGFLEGWGEAPPGELSRPAEFDFVSGVSTGALIAPFAFVGDESSFERVRELYSEPQADWVRLSGLLFFLPGRTSFLNNSGLRRDVAAQVNADVVAQIAEGAKEHRVLGIGTTDLDMGAVKAWNLCAEAVAAQSTGDLSRIHDILLASAAIPAAFPPVVIDNTLFVDGGASSNILYDAESLTEVSSRHLWRQRHPNVPVPPMRIWVIINNQLDAVPQVVQPNWPSITGASVSTAIRSSTIGSLRFLALQTAFVRAVEKLDIEMYYVVIPDDWRAPKPGIFQRETMQSLVELGHRMGADPKSWRQFVFLPNASIDPLGGADVPEGEGAAEDRGGATQPEAR